MVQVIHAYIKILTTERKAWIGVRVVWSQAAAVIIDKIECRMSGICVLMPELR